MVTSARGGEARPASTAAHLCRAGLGRGREGPLVPAISACSCATPTTAPPRCWRDAVLPGSQGRTAIRV